MKRAANFISGELRKRSHIAQIVKDEVRSILADKAVLLFFIGVQILYPLIYPVPFYHQLVRELPVALVDLDNSKESRLLSRMCDATDGVSIASRVESLDEATKLFYAQDVRGILLIPSDFSSNINKGKSAVVSVYTDASYFMLYRQVLTSVSQAAGTLSAGIELKRLTARGLPLAQAKVMRDPVPYHSIALYNPTGGYGSYLVPAVLIVILQQTMLLGIGFLGGGARERKSDHFIMPSYIKKHGGMSVMFGKSIPYLVLYMIHSLYFFGILTKLYGYPSSGNVFFLLIFLLPFILSSVFLAFSLSTFFKSRESSIIFLLSASIPFILMSGFSWPREAMPSWLRSLSLLVPTTSAVSGSLKIMQMGAGVRDVAREFLNLIVLSAVYFFASVYLFTRRAQKKSIFPFYR